MHNIVSHIFVFNFSFVCAGASLVKGLFSSCGERGYSLVVCLGFSSWFFSCCGPQALGLVDFSICISWAIEHRLRSCGAWGLVDPQHVGSSQTRDWTYVSCIGRWILYHRATRGAPVTIFKGHTPFMDIIKYWLYSLYYTIYLCSLFYT